MRDACLFLFLVQLGLGAQGRVDRFCSSDAAIDRTCNVEARGKRQKGKYAGHFEGTCRCSVVWLSFDQSRRTL